MSKSRTRSRRKKRIAVIVALFTGALTTGAIASTQSFETSNPFETSGTASVTSGIDVGAPTIGDFEPSLGDIIPNFPGLPGGQLPSTPGEIVEGGLGGIFGSGSGPIPSIFRDILSGDMGGILESIFGILTSQNEIFDEVAKVVLDDGWRDIIKDRADGGDEDTLPNPYEVRLPPEKDDDQPASLLTRSPIVLGRDRANQYDQSLGRAMAAPMLAEAGDAWLRTNVNSSAEVMQAGLTATQSAIAKSAEATEATSTQDIVRKSAEISGVTASLQLQEMQQNAAISESLWNMQRLESAQLQLSADASEAADEQNRRDRASRSAAVSSAAAESMIIPGLGGRRSGSANVPTAPSVPEATSPFAVK